MEHQRVINVIEILRFTTQRLIELPAETERTRCGSWQSADDSDEKNKRK